MDEGLFFFSPLPSIGGVHALSSEHLHTPMKHAIRGSLDEELTGLP